MIKHPYPFAINLIAIVFSSVFCSSAFAQEEIAIIEKLSGPLFVVRSNGVIKTLAENSFLHDGDVLTTERNTYAEIHFNDESRITLWPQTIFKITAHRFHKDSNLESEYELTRGVVKVKTGLGGGKGYAPIKIKVPVSQIDPYEVTFNRNLSVEFVASYKPTEFLTPKFSEDKTPEVNSPEIQLASLDLSTSPNQIEYHSDSNAIGVTYFAQSNLPPPVPVPVPVTNSAPVLTISVITGSILVTTPYSTNSFSPGNYGYTGTNTPPIIIPTQAVVLPITYSVIPTQPIVNNIANNLGGSSTCTVR